MNKLKRAWVLLLGLSWLWNGACQNHSEPSNESSYHLTDSPISPSIKSGQSLAYNQPDSLESEPCLPLNVEKLPHWFPENRVFLSRVASSCPNLEGRLSAREGSQWVAMGVPCFGGDHRFRWLENYDNPKQVIFDFGIACPMAYSQAEIAQSLAIKTGLSESKLIAFNPMSVVYWELVNTGEKDVGSLIKVSDVKKLKPYWREFLYKKNPLTFKLVGIESAWVEGRQYFEVQVDVFMKTRNRYTVQVKEAKILETKDVSQLHTTCKELTPRRDCERVF